MLPPYEATRVDDGVVRITFDPPATKARLGIPFSFLVMQEKDTHIKATRFGRIEEVTCGASRWVSYLKTRGVPQEQIDDFKETVDYQEPEPVAPVPEPEAPPKA